MWVICFKNTLFRFCNLIKYYESKIRDIGRKYYAAVKSAKAEKGRNIKKEMRWTII